MSNIEQFESIKKFEAIKNFRDLENLKLIDENNEIIDFKEKFKDFQEIYSVVASFYNKNRYIQWMNSNKQRVSYIFSQKMFVTNSIGASGNTVNDLNVIKRETNLKDITFKIPDFSTLENLNKIRFIKNSNSNYWYYLDSSGYYKTCHFRITNFYGGFYYVLAVASISGFYDILNKRNQSFLQGMNKSEKTDSFLREFEIALKYDLLDEGFIKLDDNQKEKLKKLVEMYKKYSEYISCIYVEDGTEDTVKIAFDDKKLFSLLEDNGKKYSLEIAYQENALGITKQEIDRESTVYYFNNGDKEEIYPTEIGEQLSLYCFKNGNKERRIYKNGALEGEAILKYKNGIVEIRGYRNGILEGKRILTYENGENETREYKNGVLSEESTYYFKNGDTEKRNYKDGVLEGKSIYTYKNGDIEEREYKNGALSEESTYYYKNGDIEIRNTKNGILEGKSIYTYKNGDIEEREYRNGILEGKSTYTSTDGSTEIREYRNGILQGEVVYQKDGHKRKYLYTDGRKEEMPKLKYYLSIDKERINIDDYRENRLLDPNVGHWDLKEEDKEELKELLGKEVYSRDPKLDINQGGIVGIDFGTKSTVVVYQKDRNNILPMRISGEELNKEARDTDYENPTVIEFRDLVKFKKDYDEEIGRPNTKWEDVTISHTAFRHLMDGTSEQFDSIISDIKQWTVNKNAKIEVIDKKGNKISLPPYLDLDENDENYIDPVEIYAYYIGSYINTMRNGIYLEYYLSFPVTYEKVVREKILKSFEKGIKKSLPIQIQEDEKLMKKFRVKHGSNEPAAYAVCALKKLKIEPKENEKIYYGVFDFGGGTTDFDFGIWKNSEDEDMFDYELEHFGAGGDIHLGGENILKELAYRVFSDNTSELRKRKIQYVRPEWCPELSGEEILVEYTREAKLNTRKLGEEKLRDIWEEKETERIDNVLVNLFNADGSLETGIDLKINEEELKALIKDKIEKGIKNFFIKMEDAFKDEDVKKVHIFLAGNSCRHSFVNEIFEKYVAEMKDKIELVIYDLKAIKEIDKENDSKITGKTGVAYGLIYSRKGGRIKVTNRDEKENVANEINFKFYLGNSKKDKFNPVITPNSNYGKYEFLGILTSDIFEIYYTSSPEAQTGAMEIGKDDPKIKRISLNEEYDEDERYRIYIKTVTPDKISYAIVKKEEDIETKEILEEGEVFLD
jgi:Uncharacterized protein conserved in bacteria